MIKKKIYHFVLAMGTIIRMIKSSGAYPSLIGLLASVDVTKQHYSFPEELY